jgi:tetratricopeptide (TPR) repeat protein
VCGGGEAAWGDIWSATQREAARAAFQRSGRASAEPAFTAVDRALSAYRAEWLAMRTDACEATRVRGEQSEALLDLRMMCLEDRRREVAALARLLAEADADLVDRGPRAVAELSAVRACADAGALERPIPLPADPEKRRRIDALSAALAEARALDWAGKYRRALDAAKPAAAAARALGYAPLTARLHLVLGDVEQRLAALDDAADDLHSAAALAIEARDDAVAADAWILLVRIDGSMRARPRDGERWASYAAGAIQRLGGDDEREATRLRNLATMERPDDRSDEVRALLLRARSLYERSPEPQRTLYLANVDETLGAILFFSGRPAEALDLYRRVEAARAGIFGPEHLGVALAIANEADCLADLGRLDEARAAIERALAMAETSGGYLRTRLADVLRRQGEHAAALAADRRALAEIEETGSDFVLDAALTGEGLDLLALGRAADAVAPLERALSLRERASVKAPELTETRFALARALAAGGGDRTRARALAAAARDLLRPFAERYGGRYQRTAGEIDRFLAN